MTHADARRLAAPALPQPSRRTAAAGRRRAGDAAVQPRRAAAGLSRGARRRRHPELVGAAHREYLEAGAELIETLSFGANRQRLAAWGLEGQVGRAQPAGGPARPRGARGQRARRARRRLGRAARVAGRGAGRPSPRPPPGGLPRADRRACSRAGPTLIVLETFSDLEQLLLAVDEARRASDVPVIASLTFGEELVLRRRQQPGGGRGVRSAAAGADAVGVNCGAGPAACLDALEAMGAPGRRRPGPLDHAQRRPVAAARGPLRLRRQRRVLRDGDAAPARGRRPDRRRLLRDDARAHRRDAGRARRGDRGRWPPTTAHGARAAIAVRDRRRPSLAERAPAAAAERRAAADPPRRAARRRPVRRLGRDRPAAEHPDRADDRGRPAPARRRASTSSTSPTRRWPGSG